MTWVVDYQNIGSSVATTATLQDAFSSAQTLLGEASNPPKPATVNGNTIDYELGDVGQNGTIVIRTSVPYSTTPGTVLTNTTTIAAVNDSDASNNEATAAVTVPLLPPLITYPLPGITCDDDVTVTGRAQAAVNVDVYVDSELVGTATADSDGNWSLTINVADGRHAVYAIAKTDENRSTPSPVVQFAVDSELSWNPMSLRFQRPNGSMLRPSGWLGESGWNVFLQKGVDYRVLVEICCNDPNAQVALEIGGQQIILTDPDGDGTYESTFTTPSDVLEGELRVCITCDFTRRCSDGEVLIDPEGTVFDAATGETVQGATVACLQEMDVTAGGDSIFELWPASDFGQRNPQMTDTDGYYSFFTPAGTYQVEVTKDGYQTHRSPNLVVTDSLVHYDVQLTPVVSEEADYVVLITDSGFEPSILEVEPDSVIEWINVGSNNHSVTVSAIQAATANLLSEWDSGLLETGESFKQKVTAAGTITYVDNDDPGQTGVVIIGEGPTIPGETSVFLPLVVR